MLSNRLLQLFRTICLETNTPFSLAAMQMATDGKVVELLQMRCDPRNYESAQAYYKDAVVCEFFRKYGDFRSDLLDPKKAARDTFFECEARNKITNLRMRRLHQNYGLTVGDVRLQDFLSDVRKKVRVLLGPLPRDLSMGRFGKGSTFTDTGRYITIPDKMSSRPSITNAARDFIPFWGESAWSRALCSSFPANSDPETVRGNRFTSVKKTALTDRGICIEPSLNVYWQLAASRAIRKNLMTFGYEIETAQGRHRYMACHASTTGRWATVDLKNASDLFSYWFVRNVVPDDWFELLDALRAPASQVDGKWYHLEKFSSMGNGFTFELMTVILTALCLVLGENRYALRGICSRIGGHRGIDYQVDGDISVFGDDIVCPPDVAELLIKVLPIIGLEANEKKTFLSGPFRESCGGDYFEGIDVRAYNLTSDPYEQPATTIGLANAVRRLGRQHRAGVSGFGDYMRPWFRVLDAVPSAIRGLRGPEHLGDIVIHDEARKWSAPNNTNRRVRHGCVELKCWVPVPQQLKLHHWKADIVLASALYGVPSNGVTNRGAVDGYRMRWIQIGY